MGRWPFLSSTFFTFNKIIFLYGDCCMNRSLLSVISCRPRRVIHSYSCKIVKIWLIILCQSILKWLLDSKTKLIGLNWKQQERLNDNCKNVQINIIWWWLKNCFIILNSQIDKRERLNSIRSVNQPNTLVLLRN